MVEKYVQTVPDECDRIVWRGKYYHLPLTVPDGWQIVPKALTDDMRSAVGDAETHDEAWERFLAAAPEPKSC